MQRFIERREMKGFLSMPVSRSGISKAASSLGS